MKQGFWTKLKEITPKDFLHLIFFIMALPFAAILRKKRPDMWLLCENEFEARDNAYWLFRFIRSKHPEQDVVYAINKNSADYKKVFSLGQVVEYGTLKHWVYYLAANKNISTQKGGKPNAAVCYFLEVYGLRRNKRFFLQHGIIINDLKFLYYKNTKMQMIMCSTKREYEFIKEKFGYPEENIKLTGLCRFDNLHHLKIDKKLILFMPTWRGWLSPPSDRVNVNQERLNSFMDSNYYIEWQNLLLDTKLIDFIEINNYRVVFYPHREMRKFGRAFYSRSSNIVIANDDKYDVQELLMSAALLVTDYSSVSMDFAYMHKPQIYFQFDMEMFRKNHYAKGYFDYYEDGFGPVCEQRDNIIEHIKNYAMKDFLTDKKYKMRQDAFFTLNDAQNCKRNYEAIKSYET